MTFHLTKHRSFWIRFFFVASLLTAVMIFCFSAQQGPESQMMSDGITVQVAPIIRPDFNSMPEPARLSFLNALGAVIRKCAHFLEYMLLGFNLSCLFRLWREDLPPVTAHGIGWLVATLYAGTDEAHQLLVSQRSGTLMDVGIDSGGSLTGTLIAALLLYLAARWMKRRRT